MSNVPGARVVGADKVAQYEKDAHDSEQTNIPGSRVTGLKGKKKGKVVEAPAAPVGAHFSLEEVRKTLTKTPSAVDRILAAELARAEGPRKSALQALRVAEHARAEKTGTEVRGEVIAQIDGAMGKKPEDKPEEKPAADEAAPEAGADPAPAGEGGE